MKMTKKVLSILLSLMLVLGAVSIGGVSVSAEVPAVTIWGDANCDNQVDMADVVLIMQSLANPNRYGRYGTDESHITLQGEANADVDKSIIGVTAGDTIRIQEYLLGKISSLNPNRGTGVSSSATVSDKNSDINADVSFSFTDENGSNKVNLASGENRTIEVDVNIDAGNNPISALDVQFTVTNGIKISEIYKSVKAFRGVTVGSNIYNLRANYTTLDGDSPMTAESGKSAFMIDVEVPAGTPDGVYYVDFSSCKVFKDNTSFNYTVSADPIKIVVGNETMEISTYSDLRDFASRVNSGETGLNAILMNDIECKNDDGTAAKDWTPIGYFKSDVDNNPFIGTFDGDGHVITGLSNAEVIDAPYYAGLFGYVGSKTEGGVTTKGTVKNVGLEGGSITGAINVGGVAGSSYGTVTGCYNTGAVSGNSFVSGVVGINYGTVTGCYNTGNVTATATADNAYAGGVVGINYGTLMGCYNTGNVTATATDDTAFASGVAGMNYGTLTGCYNTGNVTATATADNAYASGVVGFNNNTLTNNYNTGNVTATATADNADAEAYAGGVVGFNNYPLTNSYNTGNVTATATADNADAEAYAGGVVGFNTDPLTNSYNTGNVTATETADNTHAYAGGVVGFNTDTLANCYYDSDICTGVNAIGNGSGTNVTGLTTAQMTGANALDNMTFAYEAGEESPWQIKADGADVSGKYRLFYPHLKGFAYDRTSATEDWPAKVEITVGLSDGNSCTYDGKAHEVYVTVGDTSVPEGGDVTYSQYKYFDEDNRWEWEETSDSPTDPGNYRMTARDGDKVIETKYFTILDPYTDYTVSYYAKDGEDWSTDTVTPVNAGNYKVVVTFTDTGHDQIEKEFTINPKSLTGAIVTLSQYTAEYTVGEIMPDVTVKDGSTVLIKDIDYTIGYSNNVNASQSAKVTVTGIGNYKDHVEKTFTINPAGVTLTANSRNTDVYDGTEKTISGFTSSVEGLTFEGVTASGSGTQAGSYDVTFSGVTIGETKDSSGNYVVTATENGTLTINPAAPGTSAAAEDIDYGQTAVVTFTVPADAEGKVTFTLDEAESGVTKDIENGQAVCEFENLTIGSHKVECVYTGDGNYEPGEAKTAGFEVKSVDCPLTVNYVYADGSKAAEAYKGNFEIFKEYSVTSPEIANYTPDTATVEGTMGDDDMGGKTVTVKYSPVEYTATFVDENGETVAEVPYTVESGSIEAPAVPGKDGYNGEWEDYELTPGGITVKPVYTPADICPLDNEYHGTSFWGRLVKFFHTVIWKAFNLLGMNIYIKFW